MKYLSIILISFFSLTACKQQSESDIRAQITESSYLYFQKNGEWYLYQTNNFTSSSSGQFGNFSFKNDPVTIEFEWTGYGQVTYKISTPQGEISCTGTVLEDNFSFHSTEAKMNDKLYCNTEGFENVHLNFKMNYYNWTPPAISIEECKMQNCIGNSYSTYETFFCSGGMKWNTSAHIQSQDKSKDGVISIYTGKDFASFVMWDMTADFKSDTNTFTMLDVINVPMKRNQEFRFQQCGTSKGPIAEYFAIYTIPDSSESVQFIEKVDRAWIANLKEQKIEEIQDISKIICLNKAYAAPEE